MPWVRIGKLISERLRLKFDFVKDTWLLSKLEVSYMVNAQQMFKNKVICQETGKYTVTHHH